MHKIIQILCARLSCPSHTLVSDVTSFFLKFTSCCLFWCLSFINETGRELYAPSGKRWPVL